MYLGIYWVTYSALYIRIGLSTISMLSFYVIHTLCSRRLLNFNQCVRNLLTGNKILTYNSTGEIQLYNSTFMLRLGDRWPQIRDDQKVALPPYK